MLRTDFTPSFARDRKRCAKKHWDVAALDAALAEVAGDSAFFVATGSHDDVLRR